MKKLLILILLTFSTTNCASTCKGLIGVSYSVDKRLIDYTISNSPAERLGLLPGDELLYPEFLRGDAGDLRTVRVIRGRDVLIFPNVPLACKEDLRIGMWDL